MGSVRKVLSTKEMRVKEWADMRQNRRQKADAEEVAYTQRAVYGSLSSCTTSTDEMTRRTKWHSGRNSLLP